MAGSGAGSGSGAGPGRPPGSKNRKAAALRYSPAQQAPEVVAAGSGYVAETIIDEALRHGVPVRAQPDLAAALAALGVGAEIPPALYAAVAEVLAWVALVDQERARRWQPESPGSASGKA